MGIGDMFFPKASNAKDTIMNGIETKGITEAYQKGVNQMGADASSSFKDNLQKELQTSLGDSAAALQANLAQGEADRQTSAQMALDAKRTALQDAMNKTVINGGNSFKAAAGA